MNHAVHISQDQSFEQSSMVLEIEDIKVHYPGKKDWLGRPISVVRAVDGVTFEVREGETLGLVGESGCGKSTLARAIVNLVKVTAGKVRIDGRDVNTLTASERHHNRRKIQMIFQDPFASLNPRMTVGKIIREPMEIHGMYDRTTRKLEVMRLMDLVGLNLRFMNRYPHEFSGGQRQRVGIARAMASHPKLIICDEAVSALDVSIQGQIIKLLISVFFFQVKFLLRTKSILGVRSPIVVVKSSRVAVTIFRCSRERNIKYHVLFMRRSKRGCCTSTGDGETLKSQVCLTMPNTQVNESILGIKISGLMENK